MDAETLRDQLQAAIDAGVAARLFCDQEKPLVLGTDLRHEGGGCYPVTHVRIRRDGLIETGDGYEEWLIDPARVDHASMRVKLYPEWEKNFPDGSYT